MNPQRESYNNKLNTLDILKDELKREDLMY